ncbi:MAG: hypothetical protein EAZ15_09490, partial [Sphingobacteriales bacterium]
LNNRPRKRFGFLSPNEIFSLKLDLLHLSLESALQYNLCFLSDSNNNKYKFSAFTKCASY